MMDRIKLALKFKKYANDRYTASIVSKLARKCYWACLFRPLKGTKGFTLVFKGKYNESFPKRCKAWIKYYMYKINSWFSPEYTVWCEFVRPIHVKLSNTPNEGLLEFVLAACQCRCIEERLGTTDAAYDIVPF